MGCFSDREKGPPEETAKWDFITLSDFRCTSAWTVVAYIWLWILVSVGIAVYVVDTYTAVNLLAFNHWSSKVQPKLDFKYAKWIFAGCILLSWALCVYEWIRALRVIKRGGVAESFLDPLAVNIQSMRKQGWKRFLVFTELTKSKKGADYVALFVYFSFKTAIRVILAEGPRQVVNALTLYAVMDAQLLPGSTQDDTGTKRNNFDQFWFNVQTLADDDKQQAAVYFGMLFSLCIWVFSALSLIASGIMYILFLWHYIPQRDGRLSVYCRRKVDKRLAKIVEHKVKLGIEKEQRRAEKADRKAELQRQKTGELTPPVQAALKKQPTLPDMDAMAPKLGMEKELPDHPLARQDTVATVATLPPYSSRALTNNEQRQPTLPRIATDGHPGMPMRSGTQSSGWSAAPSYSTDAPLLANAGYGGGPGDIDVPRSLVSRHDSEASFQRFHGKTDSQNTYEPRRPFTPGPGAGARAQTPNSARPYTPGSYPRAPPAPRIPLPVRSNTAFSFDQGPPAAVNDQSPQGPYNRPFGPPVRSNTADDSRNQSHAYQGSDTSFHSLRSQQSFSRPMPARAGSQTPVGYTRAYAPMTSTVSEIKQAPSPESYEMQPQPVRNVAPPQPKAEYIAFNPSVQNRTPTPTLLEAPHRNATVTGAAPTTEDYFGNVQSVLQRSGTAPLPPPAPRHSDYAHDILAEYAPSDNGESRRPSPLSDPERNITADSHSPAH